VGKRFFCAAIRLRTFKEVGGEDGKLVQEEGCFNMNMTVRISAVLLVVGYLGFGVCADPSGKKIKQSEFGKSWPFTVNEGVLACKLHSPPKE
jgi:hypothetical protein